MLRKTHVQPITEGLRSFLLYSSIKIDIMAMRCCRDGRVREIHTGFTSRASGELDADLKAEITNHVMRLLAENAQASGANQDQP